MKVLIAEADTVCRRALESLLAGWGYQTAGASNRVEALELLEREKCPGLIIVGGLTTLGERVQLIQEIRKQREEPYAYIIVRGAPNRAEEVKEALDAGADDYLTNPSDAQELKTCVRAGRRIVQLREELLRARETIRYQLNHDPLTGLWNRAAIIEILHRELTRSRREGTCVGVMMAALDGLKSINDVYGHAAGDQAVRIAARRMRSSLRPYDEIGRYGGGVFLLVVPGNNFRNVLKLAERVQVSISAQPMELPQVGKVSPVPDSDTRVTISVGVTVGTKEDEADAIIHAVEEGIERAKSQGTNRIAQVTSPHAILDSRDLGIG
ncbi:MAG: diguanylate cyclase [Acidobacteriia bacterium]|nr:diguanylate cyclase [Terriglobia bacterium]